MERMTEFTDDMKYIVDLEEENKKLKSDLAYERTMLDNVRAEYKSLQNVIKKLKAENEELKEAMKELNNYNKFLIQENERQKSKNVEDDKKATYWKEAVGLNFNPSNDPEVREIKELYAKIIDKMNDLRAKSENSEQKRLCSVAITEAQWAQMRAVKAQTWDK